MMEISIGCDPNAVEMKNHLLDVCRKKGYEVVDMGSDDPIYANTAFLVAEYVAHRPQARGILVCGTGMGMCIAANKVHGAYAALLTDAYSAERAQKSNAVNIACLGAFTLGVKNAEALVEIWLKAEFDPNSPSGKKVKRIAEYEESHRITAFP